MSRRHQFRWQPYELPRNTNNNIRANNHNNNEIRNHNGNNNNNNNHHHINNNNEQWVRPIGMQRLYPNDEERNARVENRNQQQRVNAEERVRIAEEELATARRMQRLEAEEAAPEAAPVALIDNERRISNRERWVTWVRERGFVETNDIQYSMYLRMEDEFAQELIRVNNVAAGQGRRVDDILSDLHRIHQAVEVYAGDCLFVRTFCGRNWAAWRRRNNISLR